MIKDITYEEEHDMYYNVEPRIYTSRFLIENKVSERLKKIFEAKQELQQKGRKTGILNEEMQETEF